MSADSPNLALEWRPGRYAIVRLDPGAALPEWANSPGGFLSITHTDDELSIVIEQSQMPEHTPAERGWRLLRVRGPLEFNLIGVLARLTGALATAGVAVFAVSTYETDYLLVKAAEAGRAEQALRAVATVHEAPNE